MNIFKWFICWFYKEHKFIKYHKPDTHELGLFCTRCGYIRFNK